MKPAPAMSNAFEPLESRRMMDATPYTVWGTPGQDIITVEALPPTATTTQIRITVNTTSWIRNLPATTRVRIDGMDGNDVIRVIGSRGVDVLGGAGDDTLVGGTGSDMIAGGQGWDTADYSARTGTVVLTNDNRADDGGGGGERDNILSDIEVMNGGRGDDYLASWNRNGPVTLNGNGGNDKLFGGWGGDYLNGGPGKDYILGNNGADIVDGADDNDTVRGGEGKDIVIGGRGNDALWADAGADGVYGGDGNDRLYSGRDNDYLDGQNGNDVLVAIGGSQGDTMRGGTGRDNFWLDSEASEKITDYYPTIESGCVHRVASFQALKVQNQPAGTPSRELQGQNLPDPYVDAAFYSSFTKQNFSYVPLFADSGPRENDVEQGNVGDCYFLAPLSATARIMADAINRSVVDLGDGTYAVHFRANPTGPESIIRVDGDLPMHSSGVILGARLGTQNTLWAAVMEKAYAFYRGGGFGSYFAAGNGGQPAEGFGVLGLPNRVLTPASAGDLYNKLQQELSQSRAVTVSTKVNTTGVVNSHVYMVSRVFTNAQGVQMVELRNPWGKDQGDPGADATNDGYITVRADRLFADAKNVTSGSWV